MAEKWRGVLCGDGVNDEERPRKLTPWQHVDEVERCCLLLGRGREGLPRDPLTGRVDFGAQKNLDAAVDVAMNFAHMRRKAAQSALRVYDVVAIALQLGVGWCCWRVGCAHGVVERPIERRLLRV